eukprot:m.259499 g.259499  ORF g.259499 m.259499 type:complete len:259 (+) comp40422_c0_seq1:1104-1880(+)
MGKEAEHIFKYLQMSAEEEDDYKVVKARFDTYFIDRRNMIYEICRFRKCRQKQDESAETFITRLYTLSVYCEFGERRETEILYQLIIGMRNERLSKKLQLEKALTLEKAINAFRQEEEIAAQQSTVRALQPSQPIASLEPITRGGRPSYAHGYKPKPKPQQSRTDVSTKPNARRTGQNEGYAKQKCMRCGSTPGHARSACPAADVVCSKCNKIGHFPQVCLSKSFHNVTAAEDDVTQAGSTFSANLKRMTRRGTMMSS